MHPHQFTKLEILIKNGDPKDFNTTKETYKEGTMSIVDNFMIIESQKYNEGYTGHEIMGSIINLSTIQSYKIMYGSKYK